jgi:multidrug resistance efflux pump
VPRKPKPDPLAELERTQEQLRENIEESKQLVEKAQELIQKAKSDGEGSERA